MLNDKFPVGTNITVRDEKNPPTKQLDRLRIPELLEFAKEYLKKAGDKQANDYRILHVEEVYHVFAVLAGESPEKDIFVWANGGSFMIEIVGGLEGINPVARVPKLFMVLEPDEYYYYRLQQETIVMIDDVTSEERENIRYFEHGLGLLYDTAKMDAEKNK